MSGKPTLSFTEKVDAAHDKEVVESLQNSESGEESSSECEKSKGVWDGIKGKIIEVKPSFSNEMGKIDTITLFDKIGELFDQKMKCMVTDL